MFQEESTEADAVPVHISSVNRPSSRRIRRSAKSTLRQHRCGKLRSQTFSTAV